VLTILLGQRTFRSNDAVTGGEIGEKAGGVVKVIIPNIIVRVLSYLLLSACYPEIRERKASTQP
jgi:hypothetical protein